MTDKLIWRLLTWVYVTEVAHHPVHTIHVITEKHITSTASAPAYKLLQNKCPSSRTYLRSWKTTVQLHLSPSSSHYILSFLNNLPNSLCLTSEIIQATNTMLILQN